MSRFLFLWICILPLSQLRAFLYTDGISREREMKDVSMFKEARAYNKVKPHVGAFTVEIYIFISSKRLRIPWYDGPMFYEHVAISLHLRLLFALL